MPILSCGVNGCERPVHVKKQGLCQSHYNRFYYAGTVEPSPTSDLCHSCGGVNPPKKRANSPARKYCSKTCLNRAAYLRQVARGGRPERPKVGPRSVTCIECDSAFTARRADARFCSKRCYNAWLDKNNPLRCTADGCDAGVRAKGLCVVHWRREQRALGREKLPVWNEQRKANYQKRRAQKLQLPADNIRPLDVYERDAWVCGICSDPVDNTLAWPDPMSPSLDHILPLSLGGHHVLENVQLAHLTCNVSKGARAA